MYKRREPFKGQCQSIFCGPARLSVGVGVERERCTLVTDQAKECSEEIDTATSWKIAKIGAEVRLSGFDLYGSELKIHKIKYL